MAAQAERALSLTPSYVAQPGPSKQDKHLGVTVSPKARLQRQEFAARANCDEKKLRAKPTVFFFYVDTTKCTPFIANIELLLTTYFICCLFA
jgi:hypothetical protein